MDAFRKPLLILIALVFGSAIIGVVGLEIAEFLFRLELPPEQQTAEAIQRDYDGVVCLGCSIVKGVILFAGSFGAIVLVLVWVFVEAIEMIFGGANNEIPPNSDVS